MRLRYALILAVSLVTASCSTKAAVFGLRPEYPENRIAYSSSPGEKEIAFVEVDSLQPTLRWESFPRPQDIKEDKEGMLNLMKNVAYDLKIWSARGDFPDVVICSKQGLREPHYKLEKPLAPCSKYFWTIRARFELDGKVRVTEWGISQGAGTKQFYQNSSLGFGRWSSLVPNPNLYRFKTPCPRASINAGKGRGPSG